jgi:hypothetical protein
VRQAVGYDTELCAEIIGDPAALFTRERGVSFDSESKSLARLSADEELEPESESEKDFSDILCGDPTQ